MTYNTFVKLRGLGCLALVIAPIALLVVRGNADRAARQQQRQERILQEQQSAQEELAREQKEVAGASTTPTAEGEATAGGLSDVDREVLRMQKEPLSNGVPDTKGPKWRVKQGRVVIELRCDQDKGYNTWNRAKVDADGDKQFDETWAFKKDGTIERRVAPNDDQNYTQTFVLDGEKWVAK